MAKNNDKRAERMARSNRNVNRAITVLMAGVIAEFYLLMVNNYYVKGGVGQVLTMMTVLQVIDYIGCALFGAGLVVWLMRKKWTRFARRAVALMHRLFLRRVVDPDAQGLPAGHDDDVRDRAGRDAHRHRVPALSA